MPDVGNGRNVGVAGRDVGVGIELVVLLVALVLMLLLPSVDTESRDCDLFVGATLCDKTLGGRLILEGTGDEEDEE